MEEKLPSLQLKPFLTLPPTTTKVSIFFFLIRSTEIAVQLAFNISSVTLVFFNEMRGG